MFGFSKSRRQNEVHTIDEEQQKMIGENLNFAASEAYKLLRTNLTFSFTDEDTKRVIGVTSSMKGEGKSLTSINLAYMIAETGKKVLLMECDLRLPNIAKRLNLKSTPGLSNLLVGLNTANQVIQQGVLQTELDVIVAGDVPPNASELLESSRMQYALEKLSEYYDYVILDLPPVTAVADALVASKLASGMVIVVRQDYATKAALAETMRQMRYANARVLGFVMNGVVDSELPYKKRYYKYGYEYGYGYDQQKKDN